jgi:cellulose biosynthesis protein BcsQ
MLNTILNSLQRKKLNKELNSVTPKSSQAYVVSFVTLKGGVGKTTLAYELIQQMAAKKIKILAIDLDPQANLTLALSEMDFDRIEEQTCLFEVLSEKINPLNAIINTKSNIDLLPSNSLNSLINQSQDVRLIERMRQAISYLKTKYDFIIIDCGPTTSVAHALAVISSDLALTPIGLDAFSLQGLHKTILDIQNISKAYKHKINHKVLFNKLNADQNIVALAEKIRDSLDENLWLASFSEWKNYSLAEDSAAAATAATITNELQPVIEFLNDQKSLTTERFLKI